MSRPRSEAQHLAYSLLALGVMCMIVALARGLWTGKLFVAGSNNLMIFIAGCTIAVGGLPFQHRGLAALTSRALAIAADRTPAFLSEVARRPGFYVKMGVSVGAAQGLAESTYLVYTGTPIPWRHALWLGPLTYAVAFGLLGLVFMASARADRDGRWRLRFALWVLLTLSGFSSLLLAVPYVHPVASLLLAAGLSSHLSRMFVARAYLVGVAFRASRWVVAAGTLGVAAWSFGGDVRAAHRTDGVRGHPPAGARNVLLVVLDTVRAQSLSLYGYQRSTTPSLDRWARDGVVFESAMSTAPWTLPSHAGMFTGRWTHEFGARKIERFEAPFPTIAEAMRDHGYATAGFVANLMYTTRATGLARGFDHYEDFTISVGNALLSTALGRTLVTGDWVRNTLQYHELVNRKVASDVSGDFLKWLDNRDDRPFFAFLNYFDAHAPYMPPRRFADLFRSGPRVPRGPFVHHPNHAGPADWWTLSPDQVANEQALYDAAIASQDLEIGRLLEALDDRGILQNTAVILTSDHGELFGEHGLFNHGHNLYMPLLHVPLWIRVPGLAVPRRVAETVSLRDIPNTVLELAGIGTESSFPGSSLARFWTPDRQRTPADKTMYLSLFPSPAGEQPRTPLSRGAMRSIIEDPYHYILTGKAGEELFNYRSDPLEEHNLVDAAGTASVLRRFRQMVDTDEP